MTVWATASVDSQPMLTLIRWSVFQTETGERHLCGINESEWSGRVSQAIGSFDLDTMTAITASGRVYVLKGPPGSASDSEYVRHRWLDINKVVEYQDVTEEYWNEPVF